MMMTLLARPEGILFLLCAATALLAGIYIPPTWTLERISLDVNTDEESRLYYLFESQKVYIRGTDLIPAAQAVLTPENIALVNQQGGNPPILREYTFETKTVEGKIQTEYFLTVAKRHWRAWSLLPPFTALALCWITKEPVISLFSGIVVGAFLLGKYDITEAVLVPELSTPSAAGIIVLYLWLLGGLMGIWSRTGAAKAFADLMIYYFVRGPKSAKLVAWGLGVLFFQGGTVSTVLVGTTVKPIADENDVSHEELSYIVDSTASPIASLLAFNAWPGYVQGFIYVAGVAWLADEADRISFFFRSIPFCYYAFLAVFGTFLLSIDRAPFLGEKMRRAIKRSRLTGQLDAPGSNPLSAKELQHTHVPHGYHPSPWEFFIPIGLLIGIAVGTFIFMGTPHIRWAFGIAFLTALATALLKGMKVKDAIDGVADGLKGVVVGSVILLLAIIIGSISRDVGGGLYLVELLGAELPYWSLPVLLQIITIITSFSTGTSWGTYAITFPLAMPLSWAVANYNGLENPELFMMICFAAVMDGSVFGDQCSPISDTTVLSAMCTGCDLMDHVTTQLPQASAAALLAAIMWTATVLLFV
ncbi:MAG: Na+/H+ antiporter NhaC family protein [Chlamydiales bacterium]